MRLGFGSVSGPFDFFCGSYLIQYGLSHAIEEWIVGDGHISGPINISQCVVQSTGVEMALYPIIIVRLFSFALPYLCSSSDP